MPPKLASKASLEDAKKCGALSVATHRDLQGVVAALYVQVHLPSRQVVVDVGQDVPASGTATKALPWAGLSASYKPDF